MGVKRELPRTPAVFERKVMRREYAGEQLPDTDLRGNYHTAEENGDLGGTVLRRGKTRCNGQNELGGGACKVRGHFAAGVAWSNT